jgi:hypothetical protein
MIGSLPMPARPAAHTAVAVCDALIDQIAFLQVAESPNKSVQEFRLLDEPLEDAVAEEPLRCTG